MGSQTFLPLNALMANDSFHSGLLDQIAGVLSRKGPEPPLLVWNMG